MDIGNINFRNTLKIIMNSFNDCCSFIISKLPKAELSFIPALILGTLFSLLFMLYLYKKHHRTSTYQALKEMLKDIFVYVPLLDHDEFVECGHKKCIKCQQSASLKDLVIKKWKKLNCDDKKEYKRIADSVRILNKQTFINYKSEIHKNIKNGKHMLNQIPTLFYMDLPSNPIWTNLDVFKVEQEIIKLNMKVIKKEFESIFKLFQNGKSHGWRKNNIPSGHWCIFPLIDQGRLVEENAIMCPNLTALFRSLPSLMQDCVFGNACFSILYPDSNIDPHYGPTNLRLRYHLGLSVPDDCWLEVDGQQLRWKVGEAIVFDDSYQHSAFFGPSKVYVPPCAILILDFWHPSITKDEKDILLKLLQPFEST